MEILQVTSKRRRNDSNQVDVNSQAFDSSQRRKHSPNDSQVTDQHLMTFNKEINELKQEEERLLRQKLLQEEKEHKEHKSFVIKSRSNKNGSVYVKAEQILSSIATSEKTQVKNIKPRMTAIRPIVRTVYANTLALTRNASADIQSKCGDSLPIIPENSDVLYNQTKMYSNLERNGNKTRSRNKSNITVQHSLPLQRDRSNEIMYCSPYSKLNPERARVDFGVTFSKTNSV